MPSNPDMQKHTMNLRHGDWDFIESIYRPKGLPTSLVIRTIVSEFVDKKKGELRDNGVPKNVGVEL